MTAREAETRRRRRVRREERERLYREHVCGGPLVDHAAPVLGGGDGAAHRLRVQVELEARSRRMAVENELLAYDFAMKCNARLAVRLSMYYLMRALWERHAGPSSVPLHSTAEDVPTYGRTTIPRLKEKT